MSTTEVPTSVQVIALARAAETGTYSLLRAAHIAPNATAARATVPEGDWGPFEYGPSTASADIGARWSYTGELPAGWHAALLFGVLEDGGGRVEGVETGLALFRETGEGTFSLLRVERPGAGAGRTASLILDALADLP